MYYWLMISEGWYLVNEVQNCTYGLHGCWLCITCTNKSWTHFSCKLVKRAFWCLYGAYILKLKLMSLSPYRANFQVFLALSLDPRVSSSTPVQVHTILRSSWKIWVNGVLWRWWWRKFPFLQLIFHVSVSYPACWGQVKRKTLPSQSYLTDSKTW